MNRERWKDLFEIVGVVAIVASLIFLTLEIRTNTETNQITIFQNYSANWFDMHSQVAGNRDLAVLVEKALSGEELDRVEARQFRCYVWRRVKQSNHMLRFYDEDSISEYEARRAFRAIREEAENPRFREEIETIKNPRLRSLILDENLDRYLNDPDLARQGAN